MESVQEAKIEEYRLEVEKLLCYLPWLKEKSGSDRGMMNIYGGDGIAGNSLTFPVYDGTLMSFVKMVSQTKLMDRNYRYQYSRNQIRTVEDERKQIEAASLKEMDVLCGILSRYILGGMTRPALWSIGMKEGIYLDILLKMKKLLDFWDKPLA